MEVRHRVHGHVVMRSSECEAFIDYIRKLSDADVQQELRDFIWLNDEAFRKDNPWEQFIWKADQCILELQRRLDDK